MKKEVNINRIKVALAESGRTSRWLAETIGKNETTISRWCSNKTQPSIETLKEIADTLDIDIKDLLKSSR